MSGITCVEKDIKFNTIKDAAIWLQNNKYTNASKLSGIMYRIGEAKQSGKEYLGFHWK